jgi:hypothetical protein
MTRIFQAISHLKDQPFVLALILINLMFLASGFYILKERSAANERRDAVIERLLEKCK